MKYIGSKLRHAKKILKIVLKDRKPDQYYVEPFVGGCNVIDKVNNPRIGNDSHTQLIAMWKAIQNGWIPPLEYTKEKYIDVKNHKNQYPPELVAYMGFAGSFRAKWFGGYSGKFVRGNGRIEDTMTQAFNSMKKQRPYIVGIEFTNKSYLEMNIPPNSIIYCDPPYKNTLKYSTGNFNYDEFWDCVDEVGDGTSR